MYGSAALTAVSCSGTLSVENNPPPASNLDVMVSLTKKIVQSYGKEGYLLPGDICVVQFVETGNVPFVEHAFLESLGKMPVRLYEAAQPKQNAVSMTVQPSRVNVSYESTFRDGFFGTKYVVRVVTVGLSTKIVQQPQGSVIFSGIRTEQWRDTVSADAIQRIESPLIKTTQAPLPEESLVERFIEPVVILTATGVIIYLFYTVRS